MSHVNEPPPPLDESVPAELRAVVAALLEKDPADRPANALAVAVMLGVATSELAGLDVDDAEGINGGYLVLPVTPVTPMPAVEADKADNADEEPARSSAEALDTPTVASRPEDLLD